MCSGEAMVTAGQKPTGMEACKRALLLQSMIGENLGNIELYRCSGRNPV